LNIRDRGDFPRRRLELDLRLCFIVVRRTEGIGRAGAGRVLGLAGLRRGPHSREEWETRLGRLGGIRPMANRKLKKGFLIFKYFLNSKPI
jgi:hypothetical protein